VEVSCNYYWLRSAVARGVGFCSLLIVGKISGFTLDQLSLESHKQFTHNGGIKMRIILAHQKLVQGTGYNGAGNMCTLWCRIWINTAHWTMNTVKWTMQSRYFCTKL